MEAVTTFRNRFCKTDETPKRKATKAPTVKEVTPFDKIAIRRKTRKVFADPAAPPEIDAALIEAVWDAVDVAKWAPFHYPSHVSHHNDLSSLVPWRFHVLDHKACRRLIEHLSTMSGDASDPTLAAAMNGKIPSMLAAAGALVIVSWLPHPTKGDDANAKLAKMNDEHLMAAAAATQTLLLALTAREIRTYWSSGGALASRPVLDKLGIGSTEQFAAAIFVWPAPFENEESVPGKHRESRGHVDDFARRVTL